MCENTVEYLEEHYRDDFTVYARQVRCGTTDPYGERAVCDECRKDKSKMESLAQHDANMRADNAWLRSAGWGEM